MSCEWKDVASFVIVTFSIQHYGIHSLLLSVILFPPKNCHSCPAKISRIGTSMNSQASQIIFVRLLPSTSITIDHDHASSMRPALPALPTTQSSSFQ